MRSIAIRQRLMRLPPLSRRLLLGTIDVLLIPLAIWISFWLRTAEPLGDHLLAGLWLFPATWAIALSVYALSGQYRGLTRYVSSAAIYAVAVRNGVSVLLVYGAGQLLGRELPPPHSWQPRSSWPTATPWWPFSMMPLPCGGESWMASPFTPHSA